MTPLFAIITATYNAGPTLGRTLDSIDSQTFTDYEHIIVDGASRDNTLEIAGAHPSPHRRVVSEPDNGIYDAMNKGLALATGDAVGFLGSGDTFSDDSALQAIAGELERTGADAVYGDLVFVHPHNPSKVCRTWHGSPYRPGIFNSGWQPAHPTFYARRECFARFGGFDTSLDVSADFDLMLRFLEQQRISNSYIPRTLVRMLSGGESNGSLRNIAVAHRNIYRSFRKYGYKVPRLYSMRRLLPKILNVIKVRLR